MPEISDSAEGISFQRQFISKCRRKSDCQKQADASIRMQCRLLLPAISKMRNLDSFHEKKRIPPGHREREVGLKSLFFVASGRHDTLFFKLRERKCDFYLYFYYSNHSNWVNLFKCTFYSFEARKSPFGKQIILIGYNYYYPTDDIVLDVFIWRYLFWIECNAIFVNCAVCVEMRSHIKLYLLSPSFIKWAFLKMLA